MFLCAIRYVRILDLFSSELDKEIWIWMSLVFVAFSILWGFLVWLTFKKKWVVTSFMLALFYVGPIVSVCWACRVFPGSNMYYNRQYNEKLTGKSFWAWEVFTHKSKRSFHFDGSAVWELSFSNQTARRFRTPGNEFFTQYPELSFCHEDKERKNWRHTPIASEDQEYFQFVSSRSIRHHEQNTSLQSILKKANELMNEPGHYYAYIYNANGRNVEWYILSPPERKLITLNQDM